MKSVTKDNSFYFIDELERYLTSRNKGRTRLSRRLHCWFKLLLLRIIY